MDSRLIYPIDRNELLRMIAYKCQSIKEYQILTQCMMEHINNIYLRNLAKIDEINTSQKTKDEFVNIFHEFYHELTTFFVEDIEEAWECKNAHPKNKKNIHKKVIYLANLLTEFEDDEF